jgi:NDP-sugar pyrophosphorylase family protein
MQAIILAAGVGKRMQPLTLSRPKPLVEILGKPIIEHIIDALPSQIDEVYIVTGYKGEMIRGRLGKQYGSRAIHYVEQDRQLGTAHAVSLARPFIVGKFLLMNADDLHGPQALAEACRHPLALLVSPHDEPQRFGVVDRSEKGTLRAIVEKPETPMGNLVSTGALVLDERIFAYAPQEQSNGEYYLTDPLAQLAAEHEVHVIEQDFWVPVGYPEDIAKAEASLLARGH